MGGSSGGGQNTTVTKSDPWSGQQPYLMEGFSDAQNWLNSDTNSQYYKGDTVAPLSDTTQQAIDLQTQRALGGNPLQTAGSGLLQSMINGDYLNSNPYLDANFNAGAENIKKSYYDAINNVNSNAASAGRYGSGMQGFMQNQANDTLASNLGDLYTNTYYNNYTTERGNQNAATGQALNYANQDYTDLSKLSDAGATQDAYAQALTDADINKWNFNQNRDINKLGQYMGLIQGNYGGSTTTQTPLSGQSLLGSMLGLGAIGAGAYAAS